MQNTLTMRRTLIIVGAIVVLVGIGVGLYFSIFRGEGTLVSQPGVKLPGSETNTGSQTPTTGTQGVGTPVSGAGTEVAPRLVRISDRPVAVGAVAVFVPGILASSSPKASTTATVAYTRDPDVRIEYIERESGNVYGFEAHARTLTRLSNKTLPGIQEAVWLPDGSQAYVRFLEKDASTEHVATYALPATGDGGYFLERDLAQLSVSGSSTLMALRTSGNGSSATLSSASGSNVRALFTSALSSLNVSLGGGVFVATTRASVQTDGYAFLIDSKAGTFTRVLGPFQGLTTRISPSGKLLLYSYLEKGKTALAVLDMSANTATRLPLSTLPEKCTWSTDSLSLYCAVPINLSGVFPDDWYQGVVSTTDKLWKIDLSSRVATQLIDPKTAGSVDIDAIALSVDRTNDVLIFTNKRDKTFWMYDL